MIPPNGLSEKDIAILKHYAKDGNRELYWNYLAQLPANDGYGQLALGVVRRAGTTSHEICRCVKSNLASFLRTQLLSAMQPPFATTMTRLFTPDEKPAFRRVVV